MFVYIHDPSTENGQGREHAPTGERCTADSQSMDSGQSGQHRQTDSGQPAEINNSPRSKPDRHARVSENGNKENRLVISTVKKRFTAIFTTQGH